MPSKKTTPVLVRLERSLVERLDALAAREGLSRSALVREALRQGLDALEGLEPSAVAEASGSSAAALAAPELRTFAYWALQCAQRARRGGPARVSVAALWRVYQRDVQPRGMDAAAFRSRLEQAHQAGLLTLDGESIVL